MKNAFTRVLVCAFVVCAPLLFSGCQKKINHCVLSGVVTSDGQPVPSGTIQFIPTTSDSGASANIIDGQYTLTPDTGLVEGNYKVCIIAKAFRNKKTGELVDPNDMKDGLVDPLSVVSEDLVPPKFGVESEQFVDVGNTKKMTYDVKIVKE